MSIKRITTILAAFALMAVPAIALAAKPADKPGGNAYGKYCQGESKKHVKGEKGTAFSRCVQAAKEAAEEGTKPKKACKGLSKKHVKGEKGTEFSRCVKAANEARKDAKDEEEAEPTPTPTEEPTAEPTEEPTAEPTEEPTAEPTP